MADVRRIDYGYFSQPAAVPCFGYLIDHPAGLLLIDTGMGSRPDVDAHYRPRRVPLATALGPALADIRYVANCHLHFDHCGGNPLLPGRPVFTQRAELAAARTETDYTLPELIDAPGVVYEELDGEAEILPEVLVVPTPGHTRGHQSFVVRQNDGTVVVAGQSHQTAADFNRGDQPSWMARLLELDPRRVVFAHDDAVWEPPTGRPRTRPHPTADPG